MSGHTADTRHYKKISDKEYRKALARIDEELVKFQYWVKDQGLRIVIVFEGRDAAGKGGTIKRLLDPLNPRGCNVVAGKNTVVFSALCPAFACRR